MNTETSALLDQLEDIYSEYYGEIKERFQQTLCLYNTHSIEELVDLFLYDLSNVDLLEPIDLSNIDIDAILNHAVENLRLEIPTDEILWSESLGWV